ncbi:NAD(P)/FAD-dependent oxidoreductase [bacterium]|nr:NAD(P)/FAD-dependent oxidoreductase [bacterium]
MNNIAIIGAGPAGLTAAIQLTRSAFSPIVFEHRSPGGLLHNANLVENYPGFPDGISGTKLAKLISLQAKKHSIKIFKQEIRNVSFKNNHFQLSSDTTFIARNLIVASGTKPKTLQIPISADTNNLYYEIRDICITDSQHIGIIGAGDAAFDYALQLVSRGNRVTILNKNLKPECLSLLFNRTRQHSTIKHLPSTDVLSIHREGHKSVLECVTNTNHFNLKFDTILAAIGRKPNTDFIDFDLSEQARLERDRRLFFVGDVKNGIFRQCAIAAGDGLKVAMRLANIIAQEN